jgi:hypothetical protein
VVYVSIGLPKVNSTASSANKEVSVAAYKQLGHLHETVSNCFIQETYLEMSPSL